MDFLGTIIFCEKYFIEIMTLSKSVPIKMLIMIKYEVYKINPK